MTPLAHAIANDSILAPSQRRFGNIAQKIALFDGLHFFECSAVMQQAIDLANSIVDRPNAKHERLAFLPAPRTWIEMAIPDLTGEVRRTAVLLEEKNNMARVRYIFQSRSGEIDYSPPAFDMPLLGSDRNHGDYDWNKEFHEARSAGEDTVSASMFVVYALLAMINTPRIIMRKQHMPHRGLERKLLASKTLVGKFPLGAWTEIILRVQPPQIENGDSHEAHLTGRKALHFCRCHLRIRMGSLELVSAHWRGDPALGIKQSRYVVVQPKQRNSDTQSPGPLPQSSKIPDAI